MFFVRNLSRNPDEIDIGHKHDVTPRERNVGSKPYAFRTRGIFYSLNENFVAHFKVEYGRHFDVAYKFRPVHKHIACGKVAVSVQAYVHESRVHSAKYVFYPAFENAAYRNRFIDRFESVFHDFPVFRDRADVITAESVYVNIYGHVYLFFINLSVN